VNVCAVVPAAGRGERLGLAGPKILAPLNDTLTVWSVLRDVLMAHVERIAVVLPPSTVPDFENVLAADSARPRVSVAVQEKATGMGDAIFAAWAIWRDFESIVVVWGDQVNLSIDTLRRTLEAHRQSGAGLTFPLVRVADPYVQYIFDSDGRLLQIRQTREHDTVDANGYSDVGVFALRVRRLHEMWQEYRGSCAKGSSTEEINFLPFLVFLAERGWSTHIVAAGCVDEARGINTPADLDFARRRFARQKTAGA
jgi:bifunctional UDP-N-acetylglucosamine pyrophosphorylase / glucosamine-1-phosphate N-acetyltransferase